MRRHEGKRNPTRVQEAVIEQYQTPFEVCAPEAFPAVKASQISKLKLQPFFPFGDLD
jgi:hypothetical protein